MSRRIKAGLQRAEWGARGAPPPGSVPDREDYIELYSDFLQSSGGTLTAPFTTQDTSAAGSPTLAFVDDADDGHFKLLTDATDEAQNLTLYCGDSQHIDATKNPIFEARVSISPAGAKFTADERVVIGLAAARNATLDSNAAHAWFRMEGANLNILTESDDGTTDDDDNDSALDYVKGTFHKYRIDMSDLSAIRFEVDLEAGAGWQSAGVLAASAMTGNLQPYIEHQRDAGTEANTILVDYIKVTWDRA